MAFEDLTAVVSSASEMESAFLSGPRWNSRARSQSLARPLTASRVIGFPSRRSEPVRHPSNLSVQSEASVQYYVIIRISDQSANGWRSAKNRSKRGRERR
jgi:hypothetical protein